jgi:hypothetical protein
MSWLSQREHIQQIGKYFMPDYILQIGFYLNFIIDSVYGEIHTNVLMVV